MEEKLSGIVLGGVSYSENDKILNVFTLERGVISAKIKGVKKAGAKLKFASEPFCFAEFVLSTKGNMSTVIGASLIDSFYPVREDIVKYFCAGAVLEFIKKFYRENIISSETFLLTVKTLESIAYGENNPKSALITFLITALNLVGYALDESGKCVCKKPIVGKVFFDYRRGAFFCQNCFDGIGREINYSTYQALLKASEKTLTDNEQGVDNALRLLEYYLQNKAEERLNSLTELIKICG